MSKVFIEEETLIGIGNAIREKSGTTDLIATTDMATAISNLASGGGELKYDNSSTRINPGTSSSGLSFTIPLGSIFSNPQTTPFIMYLYLRTSSSNGSYIVIFYDGNGAFSQISIGTQLLKTAVIAEDGTMTFTANKSLSFSYWPTNDEYRIPILIYTE